jgi:hypothetical protein
VFGLLVLAFEEGRHVVLDRGGADHLGVAAFDQHGAFRVHREIEREGQRTGFVVGAAIGS